MAQQRKVLAQLVTEMTVDNSRFQKELTKARTYNQRYAESAKAANDSNVTLSDGFRRAAQHAAVLNGPLDGVAGRLSSMSSLLSASSLGAVALGGGFTFLAAKVKDSIQEFERYEMYVGRLDALLKATDHASGYTSGRLQTQARDLAEATLESIETAQQAQGVLLTFKTLTGDVFEHALYRAADLAAVMDGDIKSAALQLGKALESPKDGLNALKRSGVSFTAAEKDLITQLQETNSLAEAQGVILATLDRQIGGAASGQGSGLAGSVDLLAQRWEEFQIALGKSTAPSYQSAVDYATNVIEIYRQTLFPKDMEKLLELKAERQKALDDLRDMGSFEDLPTFNPFGFDKNSWYNATRDATQATEEIEAISERINKAKQNAKSAWQKSQAALDAAQQEAAKAQADKAAAIEAEKAQKLLEKQQAHSAKSLEQLRKRYASEQEKIDIAHGEQVAAIEALNLSAQDIHGAGYDSLLALQTDYYQKAQSARDAAIARQEAAEQEKFQKYIQTAQRGAALANAQAQHGKDSVEVRQVSVTFERDDKLAALQQEYEAIKEATALEQEQLTALEQEHLAHKQALHASYQQQLTELEAQEKEKRQSADIQYYQNLQSVQMSAMSNGLALVKNMSAEGSKMYYMALIAQKGMMVAQAYMQSQLMANQAAASQLSIPTPDAPARAAAAGEAMRNWGLLNMGLIAATGIAEVAGVAHKGIDSVPYEGTWLLDGGERVVDRTTNADLKTFLANQNQDTGQPVQITINALDGKSVEDLLRSKQNFLHNLIEKARRNRK